jgi:hypothetical protein
MEDEQGNVLARPAFVLATKVDMARPGAMENLEKSLDREIRILQVSTETMEGLEQLPARLFDMLGIVRVYAKPPGKKADMDEPFTLKKGSTVLDLARKIHRELAEKLKSARIWGTGVYDGQNVQKSHVLHDKDVVELHFS